MITIRRVLVSLMTLLMVMTHVVPSGFHFDLCHDEEDHWSSTETDSADIGFILSHAEIQPLAWIANDCCDDFSNCNTTTSHRHALRRTSQTSVSSPPCLAFSQPIATTLVADSKRIKQFFLQPETHSATLPVLRTIIIQI